ncbi:MAG: glycosyltransferase [Alphaproteobacteria bacterium]
MATVVLADNGLAFDGLTLDERPLGGAETAFVALAEALSARGHDVRAFARGARRLRHRGVAWAPVEAGLPDGADLFVANRGSRVLDLCPDARRVAFWIHNPARYLLKWRYQWQLARRRPALVFAGPWHCATYPGWAMGGRRVAVPLGVSAPFLGFAERPPPPPIAVFTSNPLRGLDRVLDLWTEAVRPSVPEAVLRVYGGAAVYADAGLARRMAPILERAAATPGVQLCAPVPKAALAAALASARVFVYGGDVNETFCLAAAEAQAVGLPAVVGRVGALSERVRDGVTGAVVDGDRDFAAATVALLGDDALWRARHRAALAASADAGWDRPAAAFEEMIG